MANQRAGRRSAERRITRVLIALAVTGLLWAVVPAICMALAGGVPA